MDNRVNRENYVNIQGWMITDLGLKGNELIIYAIIYGFSQAENQVFGGGLGYLADWTNSTKRGVMKCLQSLIEKSYIEKIEKIINGVKFCEYHATKFTTGENSSIGSEQSSTGGEQSSMGGGEQSSPNNININKLNNNLNNNTYVSVTDLFHKICISFPKIRNITDARKRLIRARLNQYSLEQIEEVFILAETSDFLKGTNGKWSANFDWLMKDSNFIKVLEGTYNNKSQPKTPDKHGGTYL